MTGEGCAICATPVIGSHYVTDRGQHYCSHHRGVSACRFCGLVTDSNDKRCSGCRSSAVVSDAQLVAAVSPVVEWVVAHTGASWFRTVPIGVAGERELGGDLSGKTNFMVMDSSLTAHIQVLAEQPPIDARETAAHEFAHILLMADLSSATYLGGHGLTPQEEEGFCEVVRMLWINHSGSADAAWRFDLAISGTDPVYSEGLRKMWPRYLSSDRTILGFRSMVLGHRSSAATPLTRPHQPPPPAASTPPAGRPALSASEPRQRPSPTVPASRSERPSLIAKPVVPGQSAPSTDSPRPITVVGHPHPRRSRPRLNVTTTGS